MDRKALRRSASRAAPSSASAGLILVWPPRRVAVARRPSPTRLFPASRVLVDPRPPRRRPSIAGSRPRGHGDDASASARAFWRSAGWACLDHQAGVSRATGRDLRSSAPEYAGNALVRTAHRNLPLEGPPPAGVPGAEEPVGRAASALSGAGINRRRSQGPLRAEAAMQVPRARTRSCCRPAADELGRVGRGLRSAARYGAAAAARIGGRPRARSGDSDAIIPQYSGSSISTRFPPLRSAANWRVELAQAATSRPPPSTSASRGATFMPIGGAIQAAVHRLLGGEGRRLALLRVGCRRDLRATSRPPRVDWSDSGAARRDGHGPRLLGPPPSLARGAG